MKHAERGRKVLLRNFDRLLALLPRRAGRVRASRPPASSAALDPDHRQSVPREFLHGKSFRSRAARLSSWGTPPARDDAPAQQVGRLITEGGSSGTSPDPSGHLATRALAHAHPWASTASERHSKN